MIKRYFKDNKFVIFLGVFYIAVTCLLVYLYDIYIEVGFYFILFGFLFWITSLIYIAVKNRERELKESEDTDIDIDDGDRERWNRVKENEDFFALWAHQIKTPIAALNLLFQMEEPDIKQCKAEVFKIEGYVEMALNYLRFDTMSNDMVLEAYSLEKIVKAVVKKHATIFINKHLSVAMDGLDCMVLTDDKWLSFCLEQIISNALKYTKEGGVSISARKVDEEIILCIEDTGIGIKNEDIPRLFEKGFTGFNGRMDKKASGIGLYLCKGVCDKLGHKLWIESVEKQGTRVYLKFARENVERKSLNKM